MLLLIRRLIKTLWPFYKDLAFDPDRPKENKVKSSLMLLSFFIGAFTFWYITTDRPPTIYFPPTPAPHDRKGHDEVPEGPPPCFPPSVCDLYERIYDYQENDS